MMRTKPQVYNAMQSISDFIKPRMVIFRGHPEKRWAEGASTCTMATKTRHGVWQHSSYLWLGVHCDALGLWRSGILIFKTYGNIAICNPIYRCGCFKFGAGAAAAPGKSLYLRELPVCGSVRGIYTASTAMEAPVPI